MYSSRIPGNYFYYLKCLKIVSYLFQKHLEPWIHPKTRWRIFFNEIVKPSHWMMESTVKIQSRIGIDDDSKSFLRSVFCTSSYPNWFYSLEWQKDCQQKALLQRISIQFIQSLQSIQWNYRGVEDFNSI